MPVLTGAQFVEFIGLRGLKERPKLHGIHGEVSVEIGVVALDELRRITINFTKERGLDQVF
ncbi:hypothetical protein [Tateyamaria sp.]|uniref:hypothetical protein n=1 Tax=Tateyamaria sp. TaxID=1929288 RepID=UPI00328F62CE